MKDKINRVSQHFEAHVSKNGRFIERKNIVPSLGPLVVVLSRDREAIYGGRSDFRSDQLTNTAMVATINFAINIPRQNMSINGFELLNSATNLAPIERTRRILSIGAKLVA